MLRSYLLTAVRAIRKSSLTSLITVVGFSVGIACALFIFLYVSHELSFDRFLPGHDRIHRVLLKATSYDGGEFTTANIGPDIKDILRSGSGSAEAITQIVPVDALLGYGDRRTYEQNSFILSDSAFLNVLPYPLAAGDARTALEQPMSVILTRSMAEKYFGKGNPIGQTLSFSNVLLGSRLYYFTVTGVLENLPSNSTFRFGFVANCPSDQVSRDAIDYYNRVYAAQADKARNVVLAQTFVRLRDASATYELEKALGNASDMLIVLGYRQVFKTCRLFSEPLDSIYLFSAVDSPVERHGNFLLILLLVGLGVIVIVIACLNVINLTTARAMTRVKEIGIRKSLGARRGELILQYLVESVLLSFFSLFVALVAVELLLPVFNGMVNRELTMRTLAAPFSIACMIALALLIGILAGFYPAFLLSSFSVVKVLRGQRERSSRRLREAMVVVQFVFSIGLFVASSAILREFDAVSRVDFGFDSRNLLMVRLNVSEVEKHFPDIKKAVLDVPGVRGVTASSSAAWRFGQYAKDFPVTMLARQQYCNVMVVDTDFLRVSGITLAEGKDFGTDYFKPNTNQLIVNDAARRQLGYNLNTFAYEAPLVGQVVGITRNFDYVYPSRRVAPLVLTLRSPFLVNSPSTPAPVHLTYMLVRMQPDRQQQIVRDVEATWKKVCPGSSFEYQFVDKEIRGQLEDVNASSRTILAVATVLAFLLSGLGLFGLASFEMERRTKEVGIRKVLGATSGQVVLHFLAGFLRLVGLANLVAWPAAFVLVRMVFGLIQYPRTLSIGPLVFLEAALLSTAVTVLTVGAQTLRAASANPVNTLRYE